ncbi:MAG: ribosomal-processing cysteine protease Prp [Lachnospiraceae bacterium]|nr:ribosomal-processing cysteine protease Prp [Lachnospiraceae bacterium]
MTEVNFYTTGKGELLGFHVSGHSGFAEEGEDIVCAAVSSASYMAVNTITDVMHIDADISLDDAELVFRIFSKNASACRDILQGFKLHMLNLEEQYQNYIRVKYTEV